MPNILSSCATFLLVYHFGILIKINGEPDLKTSIPSLQNANGIPPFELNKNAGIFVQNSPGVPHLINDQNEFTEPTEQENLIKNDIENKLSSKDPESTINLSGDINQDLNAEDKITNPNNIETTELESAFESQQSSSNTEQELQSVPTHQEPTQTPQNSTESQINLTSQHELNKNENSDVPKNAPVLETDFKSVAPINVSEKVNPDSQNPTQSSTPIDEVQAAQVGPKLRNNPEADVTTEAQEALLNGSVDDFIIHNSHTIPDLIEKHLEISESASRKLLNPNQDRNIEQPLQPENNIQEENPGLQLSANEHQQKSSNEKTSETSTNSLNIIPLDILSSEKPSEDSQIIRLTLEPKSEKALNAQKDLRNRYPNKSLYNKKLINTMRPHIKVKAEGDRVDFDNSKLKSSNKKLKHNPQRDDLFDRDSDPLDQDLEETAFPDVESSSVFEDPEQKKPDEQVGFANSKMFTFQDQQLKKQKNVDKPNDGSIKSFVKHHNVISFDESEDDDFTPNTFEYEESSFDESEDSFHTFERSNIQESDSSDIINQNRPIPKFSNNPNFESYEIIEDNEEDSNEDDLTDEIDAIQSLEENLPFENETNEEESEEPISYLARAAPGHIHLQQQQSTPITRPSNFDLRKKPFTGFNIGSGITGLNNPNVEFNKKRRCQYDDGKLWPSATMCDDELGTEACLKIFGGGTPRPNNCYNPSMTDLTRRCAKTCKICCETSKYHCVDKAAKLIDCNKHRAKCFDPAWYKVMMIACENTCGLCDMEKCYDAAQECDSLKSLCEYSPVRDIMQQQCSLTCKQCRVGASNKGKTSPFVGFSDEVDQGYNGLGKSNEKELVVVVRPQEGVRECVDQSPTCALHTQLCDDKRYTKLLTEKCAKTCKFCGDLPLVEVETQSAPEDDDFSAFEEIPSDVRFRPAKNRETVKKSALNVPKKIRHLFINNTKNVRHQEPGRRRGFLSILDRSRKTNRKHFRSQEKLSLENQILKELEAAFLKSQEANPEKLKPEEAKKSIEKLYSNSEEEDFLKNPRKKIIQVLKATNPDYRNQPNLLKLISDLEATTKEDESPEQTNQILNDSKKASKNLNKKAQNPTQKEILNFLDEKNATKTSASSNEFIKFKINEILQQIAGKNQTTEDKTTNPINISTVQNNKDNSKAEDEDEELDKLIEILKLRRNPFKKATNLNGLNKILEKNGLKNEPIKPESIELRLNENKDEAEIFKKFTEIIQKNNLKTFVSSESTKSNQTGKKLNTRNSNENALNLILKTTENSTNPHQNSVEQQNNNNKSLLTLKEILELYNKKSDSEKEKDNSTEILLIDALRKLQELKAKKNELDIDKSSPDQTKIEENPSSDHTVEESQKTTTPKPKSFLIIRRLVAKSNGSLEEDGEETPLDLEYLIQQIANSKSKPLQQKKSETKKLLSTAKQEQNKSQDFLKPDEEPVVQVVVRTTTTTQKPTTGSEDAEKKALLIDELKKTTLTPKIKLPKPQAIITGYNKTVDEAKKDKSQQEIERLQKLQREKIFNQNDRRETVHQISKRIKDLLLEAKAKKKSLETLFDDDDDISDFLFKRRKKRSAPEQQNFTESTIEAILRSSDPEKDSFKPDSKAQEDKLTADEETLQLIHESKSINEVVTVTVSSPLENDTLNDVEYSQRIPGKTNQDSNYLFAQGYPGFDSLAAKMLSLASNQSIESSKEYDFGAGVNFFDNDSEESKKVLEEYIEKFKNSTSSELLLQDSERNSFPLLRNPQLQSLLDEDLESDEPEFYRIKKPKKSIKKPKQQNPIKLLRDYLKNADLNDEEDESDLEDMENLIRILPNPRRRSELNPLNTIRQRIKIISEEIPDLKRIKTLKKSQFSQPKTSKYSIFKRNKQAQSDEVDSVEDELVDDEQEELETIKPKRPKIQSLSRLQNSYLANEERQKPQNTRQHQNVQKKSHRSRNPRQNSAKSKRFRALRNRLINKREEELAFQSARKIPHFRNGHKKKPTKKTHKKLHGQKAAAAEKPPLSFEDPELDELISERKRDADKRIFDGILRDRNGIRFDKSELNIKKAIARIRLEYDVSSSSSGGLESDLNNSQQQKEVIVKNKAKPEEESTIISKEREITKELKAILRDLIQLKKNRYLDKTDASNEDLKKFLLEQRRRKRNKLLLRRALENTSLDDDLIDPPLEDRPLRRRLIRPSRVLVIDSNGGANAAAPKVPRRRYDPLTGGYVYDAIPEAYAAVPTPIAYGPRTPATKKGGIGSPRVSASGATYSRGGGADGTLKLAAATQTPLLRNTGGFTHPDVGTGFGPIPPELCRDYYPYCEQIVPGGFCISDIYPLKMKREFCPDSCNLC